MTFTKEQLIARAETVLSNARTAADFHDSKPYHLMDVQLAEITLASLTAEPVLYAAEETLAYAKMGEPLLKCLSQPTGDAVIPLYTAPQAPVSAPDFGALTKCIVQRLVDYCTADDEAIASAEEFVYCACRAAMFHEKAEPVTERPELTVWYGSMPESNGKTNWTAILHRKGEGRCFEGFTIDCSEYPGRVLYAADRVRYLIGEKKERPSIIDYDADAHSGYVKPGNSPAHYDLRPEQNNSSPAQTPIDHGYRPDCECSGCRGLAAICSDLNGSSPVITGCWCHACRPVAMTDMRLVVCPTCGNKRCPHANDHRNVCTGSNEPGQEGSAYPAAPQQE